MDRGRPHGPEQHTPEQASGLGNEAHGLFFTTKTRQTGAAIYTQVVLFLSEATLAGVVGNAIYDSVRSTLRTIARRWRASVMNADADERYLARLQTSEDLDRAVVLIYGR